MLSRVGKVIFQGTFAAPRARAARGVLIFIPAMLLLAGAPGRAHAFGKAAQVPQIVPGLEHYDNGFFSIDKPRGWQVATGGYGSSFSYLVRDTAAPLRQIVYYGEAGPVYLSRWQQMIDRRYVQMGGFPNGWMDMPVVAPLTPENFLEKIPLILHGRIMQGRIPNPDWRNFQIIETTPEPSLYPIPGCRTSLIRALFTQDGRVGEGLFLVSVFPLIPQNGGPGAGIGYSFGFSAVAAPQSEFCAIAATLLKAQGSAVLSRAYVAQAIANSNSRWARVAAAGRTLAESSDIIMKGWEYRSKVYDIIAERRSDVIRGVERVYDPQSGQVYTVPNGWYDKYDLHRNRYRMNNLKMVPPDSPLFLKATLDGRRIH